MKRLCIGILLIGAAAGGTTAVGARDLSGERGVVLAAEDTEILTRVSRISPETQLEPVVTAAEVAPDQGAEDAEGLDSPPADEIAAVDTNSEIVDDPGAPYRNRDWNADPTQAPVLGSSPVARPILESVPSVGEGRAAPEELAALSDADLPTQINAAPVMAPGTEGSQEPDTSGVELFGVPEGDPKLPDEEVDEVDDNANEDGEYDVAALGEAPATFLPTVAPRRAPPRFDSGAFQGTFSGVGQASGMELEIATSGPEVSGRFTDSAGQIFSLSGELGSIEGRAQAAVLSGQVMIGFFDFQLTNLGLGALFVPLDDDMTPLVDVAQEYEFLRALSPEAMAALEVERSAREAELDEESHDDAPRPRLRRYDRHDQDYDYD